jgi:hypothetical protein
MTLLDLFKKRKKRERKKEKKRMFPQKLTYQEPTYKAYKAYKSLQKPTYKAYYVSTFRPDRGLIACIS